jgi:hypothetical protein
MIQQNSPLTTCSPPTEGCLKDGVDFESNPFVVNQCQGDVLNDSAESLGK